MKNLPDKIYLNFGECSKEEFDEADFHDLFSEDVTWSEDDVQGRNVEYVHKDAFIEKAANWLRTHSEADYFELIPSYNYCGAGNLNKKKMIEDFRKYLEE